MMGIELCSLIITDGHPLLKQILADKSDREQSIEPIVVGVHTTDKRPLSKKLGSYYIVYDGSLAFESCSLILTRETMDAHS